MSHSILTDARVKPHLFEWNGPADNQAVREWIRRHRWTLPRDLVEFWVITGGGRVFETERFLKPLVPRENEDGVEYATDWFARKGMQQGLVVFHEGFNVTAATDDARYVTLDRNAKVIDQYASLEEWYVQVLRAEYAFRYGLPPS